MKGVKYSPDRHQQNPSYYYPFLLPHTIPCVLVFTSKDSSLDNHSLKNPLKFFEFCTMSLLGEPETSSEQTDRPGFRVFIDCFSGSTGDLRFEPLSYQDPPSGRGRSESVSRGRSVGRPSIPQRHIRTIITERRNRPKVCISSLLPFQTH